MVSKTNTPMSKDPSINLHRVYYRVWCEILPSKKTIVKFKKYNKKDWNSTTHRNRHWYSQQVCDAIKQTFIRRDQISGFKFE